jgi:N-glycosylase/DNA lyase
LPASIPAPNFDLAETLDSGQVFHWTALDDGSFIGCIGDEPVRLRMRGEQLLVWPTAMKNAVRRYFRLEQDHAAVLKSFPKKDKILRESVAFCPGLRILRQPLWECLATFITSSLKQVAHIRKISLELRRRFGVRRELDGETVFAYPTPKAFVKAGEAKLRECGTGYRAVGLLKTARRLASGEASLEDAENLDDADARAFLCDFHGVGEKIANCVLLFGYGRLEAFPIDVWIERVLRDRYFDGGEVPRKELETFVAKHFGPFGGYAQQYLFHFARKTQSRGKK